MLKHKFSVSIFNGIKYSNVVFVSFPFFLCEVNLDIVTIIQKILFYSKFCLVNKFLPQIQMKFNVKTHFFPMIIRSFFFSIFTSALYFKLSFVILSLNKQTKIKIKKNLHETLDRCSKFET